MAAPLPQSGLVFDDLARFPDDHLRRELIDGELIVTPAPRTRHQQVVASLTARLFDHQRTHGGVVLPAPADVLFAQDTVLEPDVLFVARANLARLGERFVDGPPDLVIEVSSPSTRHLELVRKRDVYERFRVPEYWFVDLDAERVEVYRLGLDGFSPPVLFGRGQTLQPAGLPGLSVAVAEVLGPWPQP